ncbi:Acg family FMN-binding oxidoreductase [Pandoraea commovens]|uniref:Nitroreductase n=1 Tax=Pandoraea commovens TaxID=2508289 RepID=A0A5E4RJS6_9BURK|nr:nitroreductase family protein [Pandoraea commovens]UVA81961.1 nitroreductase family protein [Pandoraea commovens]VVD63537.1 nitroreductase [Pandoraea commovens]
MTQTQDDRLHAWCVDEQTFPTSASAHEKLRFCLQYAILAPSTHNTQPWRFVLGDDNVLLCADRSRGLPVSDTYDRELAISCGAALFNLRVALSHFGCAYAIRTMPASAEPDVIASVQLLDEGFIDGPVAGLFAAIPRRVTNRQMYDTRRVPQAVVDQLCACAESEGARLQPVADDAGRMRLGELIDRADRAQLGDARFRRELALWVSAARRDDGMASYSSTESSLLDFASPVLTSVVRTFDIGGGIAASHRRIVEGSPLLVCLSTPADNQENWIMAGQAMQRVLLTLTDNGLYASFLNQPIEVEALRADVGAGASDHPQLLLRVGYGASQAHTPRRSLASVVS